jgi:hypothetical protein
MVVEGGWATATSFGRDQGVMEQVRERIGGLLVARVFGVVAIYWGDWGRLLTADTGGIAGDKCYRDSSLRYGDSDVREAYLQIYIAD